jgi:hypothetical protein
MDKIYFVRHQAHGIVHEFPFAKHPTQAQVAAVNKWCFQLHGFGHAKTPGEPYWTKVVERDVLADEVPVVADRVLTEAGKANEAATKAGEFGIAGVGQVSEGKTK